MKKVTCIAAVLAIALLSAYLVWRNSPHQRVVRFLNEFTETFSVYESDAGLVRKARIGPLLAMLTDPLVVEIQSVRMKRSASHDTIANGYLGVTSHSKELIARFEEVKVLDPSKAKLAAEAFLITESDFGGGRYSVQVPVRIYFDSNKKTLRMARIVETSKVERRTEAGESGLQPST